jgi:hypothetical protein
MNRWSRIVAAIAVAGCLAWLGAGLAGRSAGSGPQPLALQNRVGFGATLTLLLADVWVIVYLATGARLARAAGFDLSRLARGRRVVYSLAVLAAVLAVTQFTLAGALFPGRMAPAVHVALALAALAAQIAFLIVAVRHLARHEVVLASL